MQDCVHQGDSRLFVLMLRDKHVSEIILKIMNSTFNLFNCAVEFNDV